MPQPPAEPAEPVVASIRPDGDAPKSEEKSEGVAGEKQEEAVPAVAVAESEAIKKSEGDEVVIAATNVQMEDAPPPQSVDAMV